MMSKDYLNSLVTFKNLISDYKKRNDGKLPVFESLEINKGDENEPPHIYVKECDYLGNTCLSCVSDSYDEYGEDCLMVQEAIKIADLVVSLSSDILSVYEKEINNEFK